MQKILNTVVNERLINILNCRASSRNSFGGAAALAMSIIAFVVSRKVPSKTISILLFVNGGIIIIGEIMISLEANFSSEGISSMARNVIVGLSLTGLGIWKIISDQKVLSKQGYT